MEPKASSKQGDAALSCCAAYKWDSCKQKWSQATCWSIHRRTGSSGQQSQCKKLEEIKRRRRWPRLTNERTGDITRFGACFQNSALPTPLQLWRQLSASVITWWLKWLDFSVETSARPSRESKVVYSQETSIAVAAVAFNCCLSSSYGMLGRRKLMCCLCCFRGWSKHGAPICSDVNMSWQRSGVIAPVGYWYIRTRILFFFLRTCSFRNFHFGC